jgi:hypothetical protein
VSDDGRRIFKDSESLKGEASPVRERCAVVHGGYSMSAASPKTLRSANFVSGETAGGGGFGTLTVG